MYKKPRLHHRRNKPMAIIREVTLYILEKKKKRRSYESYDRNREKTKRKGAPRQIEYAQTTALI